LTAPKFTGESLGLLLGEGSPFIGRLETSLQFGNLRC
jgi:hypothetical protein